MFMVCILCLFVVRIVMLGVNDVVVVCLVVWVLGF